MMKSTEHTLDERSINANPILQFTQWLDEAIKAKIPEPTAMTLATVSGDGKPSARIVLLKDVGERGFVFYTNYLSRKGKELDVTPLAALVFLWKELERQVRIEGTIQKISADESEQYFQSRPRDSQISALISQQSTVVKDRSELEQLFAEKEKLYNGQPIPRPKHWGGYCLEPTSIEFWQGRRGRLHDRLLFTRTTNGWTIQRLAP